MYMSMKPFLVLLALSGSLTYFVFHFRKLILLMKAVQKSGPTLGHWWERVEAVIFDVVLQRKVREKKAAGGAHALIFWGFVVITIGTAEMIVEGIFHGVNLSLISVKGYGMYLALADIMTLCVLLGVMSGFIRRTIIKPAYLRSGPDAFFVLAITASLMLSLFGMNIFKVIASPDSILNKYFILSGALAHTFGNNVSPATAHLAQEFFYWAHLILVLGFMMYIPKSKHLHIVAAGPNIFFKHLGTPKAMLKTNLEDENATSFGLAKASDISWKNTLDLYACTECGRCEEACPANLTGKPLSPSRLIHDLKVELLTQKDFILNKKFEELPNVIREGSPITEDVMWSCTSCRACEETCPVNIEQTNFIFESRKNLVLMESKFPTELQAVFKNLENNYAPWAFGQDSRADWCKDLNIKQMADHPNTEILYYVGCAGSFDDRAKKVATAVVNLLKKANIDFAILGKEEKCCGDPARRAGNEYLAQTLINSNVETFNRYKPKKILTACPHCFNSLKNEYPQFGAQYDVVHHTTFLADLISTGKLKPHKSSTGEITFHDSCYLGRWNDIYDDPRKILQSIPELSLKEMPRTKNKGLCCGAGGARMFMEENIGTRINENRTDEALATGAKTIASACPFCSTMLTDGVKSKDKQDSVAVRDVAEILDEATN